MNTRKKNSSDETNNQNQSTKIINHFFSENTND
ncbi:MAG: hypothetical protein ACD_46C00164G0005 [uncultured bacterium]|nr:MAG: hypothetical protein ACD_46C00164G0005 [uncultured bacterium]